MPRLTAVDVRALLVVEFVLHLAASLKSISRRNDWLTQCLLPWLQVHRFAGRERAFPYPRDPDTGEIFDYHTGIRQQQADGRKRRREANADRKDPLGLKSLEELDQ